MLASIQDEPRRETTLFDPRSDGIFVTATNRSRDASPRKKMNACGLGAVWRSFSRTFRSQRFPPEMWCSQRLSDRTNNRCESFHSAFVKQFPSHNGRPGFGGVVNCINMSLTSSAHRIDAQPTRSMQLEMENRVIETILTSYANCLDANDLFKCLEKLAARKSSLSIDLDEVDSRVETSTLENVEIDLEEPTPSTIDISLLVE